MSSNLSMGVMHGIPMEQFCPLHETAFERSPKLKSWLIQFFSNQETGFFEDRAWATSSGVLRLLPPMLWWNSLEKPATKALLVCTSSLLLDSWREDGGDAWLGSVIIISKSRLALAPFGEKLNSSLNWSLFVCQSKFWGQTRVAGRLQPGHAWVGLWQGSGKRRGWGSFVQTPHSHESPLPRVEECGVAANVISHWATKLSHVSVRWTTMGSTSQTQVGDKLRHSHARRGDHSMVPFQYDSCHFQNIMGRNPWVSKWEDHEILEHIRRANLDAFWSRESSTVAFNLREARRMELKVADRLGMPSITPPMGPFPLQDECSMSGTIAMLDRSLDPGRCADKVQHWVLWKVRSAVTNILQAGAGAGGLEDSIGACQRNKIWVTKASAQKSWLSRFIGAALRIILVDLASFKLKISWKAFIC
jgi:hypothetical protein